MTTTVTETFVNFVSGLISDTIPEIPPYTIPSNTIAIIQRIGVQNTHTSNVIISLYAVPPNKSAEPATKIPGFANKFLKPGAENAIYLSPSRVLTEGSIITFKADINNVVLISVDGYERTTTIT